MKSVIKGDIVHFAKQGHFDVIFHGQNCIHGWQKGVANTIGLHFPAAKKADLKTVWRDKKKMGTFSQAKIILGDDIKLIVVNAYTQYKYGQGIHLNMRALRECIIAIKEAFPQKRIGYPMVGAGNAGGNWSEISAVIDENFVDINHTLVIY